MDNKKSERFGYDNPCGEKDCPVCRTPGQVHMNVDEEITVADWLNKNLKKKFQEDNK